MLSDRLGQVDGHREFGGWCSETDDNEADLKICYLESDFCIMTEIKLSWKDIISNI